VVPGAFKGTFKGGRHGLWSNAGIDFFLNYKKKKKKRLYIRNLGNPLYLCMAQHYDILIEKNRE